MTYLNPVIQPVAPGKEKTPFRDMPIEGWQMRTPEQTGVISKDAVIKIRSGIANWADYEMSGPGSYGPSFDIYFPDNVVYKFDEIYAYVTKGSQQYYQGMTISIGLFSWNGHIAPETPHPVIVDPTYFVDGATLSPYNEVNTSNDTLQWNTKTIRDVKDLYIAGPCVVTIGTTGLTGVEDIDFAVCVRAHIVAPHTGSYAMYNSPELDAVFPVPAVGSPYYGTIYQNGWAVVMGVTP